MDWSAQQARYGALQQARQQVAEQPKKKGPQGLQKFLIDALPTVGGALGAVGGSLIAPVAGTAAGGAGGAGLGEFLAQQLRGEETDLGKIGTEAAFGAIPGAGKLLKGGAGIVKAATRGEDLKGLADGYKSATGAVKAADSGVARPSGILGKVNDGAKNSDVKQSGLSVGQSVNGKTLLPNRSDELYEFARGRGVKSGAPITQARQAQQLLGETTSKLDETLDAIDRPVVKNELSDIANGVKEAIGQNAAITRSTATADKLLQKVGNAKTLSELEQIRREADALAYTSRGAGKTAAAAQAHEVRDAIDRFITPLSPEYKAAKADYINAKDLLELSSKNSKNAKGINVLGADIGTQAIPGIKSKAADILKNATQGGKSVESSALATAFRPSSLIKPTIAQAVPRGAANLLANDPTVDQAPTDAPASPELPSMNPESTQLPGSVWDDPEAVKSAYTRALMAGDKESANAILAGYKAFGATAAKPLSAEASKVVANANSGLTSLAQLRGTINDQGGVSKGTLVPGRELLGGLGASVLGTGEYDTAARNIKDVITRLRTGAALTKEEADFYEAQIPGAFDSPEVREQKLNIFEDLFSSVANRTGSAGTDTQSALGL